MVSMTVTRLLSAFVLFVVTLVVGALPPILFDLWRRRRQRALGDQCRSPSTVHPDGQWVTYQNMMKILMFFGGGVLLATCFIHLMPEVRENLEHYLERQSEGLHPSNPNEAHNHSIHDHEEHHEHNEHEEERHNEDSGENSRHSHGGHGGDSSGHHHHDHKHGIPAVELAVCVGFFVIYLLEEIVHSFIPHHHHDHHHHEDDGKGSSGVICNSRDKKHSIPCYTREGPDGVQETSFRSHGSSANSANGAIGGHIAGPGSRISIASLSNNHNNQMVSSSRQAILIDSSLLTPQRPATVRFVQGLVTIVAFSAHSIFDGVAIGLQTETTRLWTMFFAICSHKLVVSLAVGMELFEKTESAVMTSILMAGFAAMSPIGIFIVIGTQSRFSEDESPVMIMLSAVATGTILYIVFFEVLQRERKDREPRFFGILLYIVMLTGFALMFCMTIFLTH